MIHVILYFLIAGAWMIYDCRKGLSQAFNHFSSPFNYIVVGAAMMFFMVFAGLTLPFIWIVPLSDYLGKPI